MSKKETELSIPLDENQYGWVELPSKGECYPHKKGKVPVAYLTAADENIIVSKELRNKRKVSDTLLERKILDKSFCVKELCIGDRDAILLWLRKTGYGDKIRLSQMNDNGEIKETIINLNDVTYTNFNGIADENGYVEYITEKNDKIKFKLLTYEKENIIYEKIFNTIILKDISNLNDSDVFNLIKELLCKQTISINGNSDKEYIVSFINEMNLNELCNYLSFTSYNTPRVNIDIRIDDDLFNDIK